MQNEATGPQNPSNDTIINHLDVYNRERSKIQRLQLATRAALAQASSLDDVRLYQHRDLQLTEELDTIRTPLPQDIEYRKKLKANFAHQLQSRFIGNSQLRFHGASTIGSRHIISDKRISSAQDRIGTQMSQDVSGFISVTEVGNCNISINDYIDINRLAMPLGCLFVTRLSPEAAKHSAGSMAMTNADFESGQLVAILASPEMLPTVKKWLELSGIPSELAMEYFSFIDSIPQPKVTVH